jgi:hypothetical protein
MQAVVVMAKPVVVLKLVVMAKPVVVVKLLAVREVGSLKQLKVFGKMAAQRKRPRKSMTVARLRNSMTVARLRNSMTVVRPVTPWEAVLLQRAGVVRLLTAIWSLLAMKRLAAAI